MFALVAFFFFPPFPGVLLFLKPKTTRGFFRSYQVSVQNILMHLKLSCACSLKPGKRVSVCVCDPDTEQFS